jgi:hypothetical protein
VRPCLQNKIKPNKTATAKRTLALNLHLQLVLPKQNLWPQIPVLIVARVFFVIPIKDNDSIK